MAEHEKPIYIGNGKEVNSRYVVFRGSICASDIPKESLVIGKNGKKYFNFVIGLLKEVRFKNTHYVAMARKPKPSIPDFGSEPEKPVDRMESKPVAPQPEQGNIPF